MHNDIALLKVWPIKFSDKVQKIKISSKFVVAGTEAVSVGWGRISTDGPISTMLRTLNLTVINNSECKERHVDHSDQVSDGHVCTMSAGVGKVGFF